MFTHFLHCCLLFCFCEWKVSKKNKEEENQEKKKKKENRLIFFPILKIMTRTIGKTTKGRQKPIVKAQEATPIFTQVFFSLLFFLFFFLSFFLSFFFLSFFLLFLFFSPSHSFSPFLSLSLSLPLLFSSLSHHNQFYFFVLKIKEIYIKTPYKNNKIIKIFKYSNLGFFFHFGVETKRQLNVVFNSLPFWVFLGCVLFFLFFCFAVGVSGDLFLLFLDCLKPTPQ